MNFRVLFSTKSTSTSLICAIPVQFSSSAKAKNNCYSNLNPKYNGGYGIKHFEATPKVEIEVTFLSSSRHIGAAFGLLTPVYRLLGIKKCSYYRLKC